MASIEERLNERLKTAMRAKDQRTLNLLRMVKAKMTETLTAKGFSGEKNDALWVQVVEAYVKSQQKALEQYRQAGEAGREHAEQIEWEVANLQEYLPQKADAETVRGWVREVIEGLGGRDRAKTGQVMGAVLKAHKADADPALVRQIVDEELA